MYPNIYKALAGHNRMTIRELAARMGISPKSMSNKLNGRTEFTRREMCEIQKVFGGIPLDELFDNNPTDRPA